MEFFDKLSETIVSAGKDVGQKAKDVSGIAKLKMDIRSKEDFVEKRVILPLICPPICPPFYFILSVISFAISEIYGNTSHCDLS